MNQQATSSERRASVNRCSPPIELYIFIDPLCSDCLSLQPLLRRLQVDYEQYFSLRIVLRTSIRTLNKEAQNISCKNPYCEERHLSFPSLAIKAAEFQGKRAGFRFLSKLLLYASLQTRDITSFDVLVDIAHELQLDVDEFKRDFSSPHVLRALQIDLYLAREMDVETAPTFVFFNENIEDEGLKVSGVYSYDIYEQILTELTDEKVIPSIPPSLEDLLIRFDALTTEEIASIYRIPLKTAERELKKKLLQQHVERTTFNQTTLWSKKTNICPTKKWY